MTVPYGYPSNPTVQGQYPMCISAVRLYKGNTLWVSQQPYCIMTVYYGYSAALLYKDSALCAS